MEKIYVLLMQTYTIPARLVTVFTNYEYSHVGIALDRKCDEIYSFGRKKLNSILHGGFVVEKKMAHFLLSLITQNAKFMSIVLQKKSMKS